MSAPERPALNQQDATFLPDEQLTALVQRVGTPFYLYDETSLRMRARKLREAFQWNAGFRAWFPVRVMPNPSVLRILKEEGQGVLCTTTGELRLARCSGFAAEEIRFAPAFPTVAELEAARTVVELGLDDAGLIPRMERLGELPDCVALRYHPDGKFHVRTRTITKSEGSRFGMQKPDLFRAARELRLKGVRSIGLMAELGTNLTEPEYLPTLAQTLFSLAVELKEQCGVRISFCDLGGGLATAMRLREREANISAIARGVQMRFEEIMQPAGLGDCAVQTELGRWMTAHCAIFLTGVTGVKHGARDYLAVDMSRGDLLRPEIYATHHHISVLGDHRMEGRRRYAIADRTAETKEPFGLRMLPECCRGSVLVFHDTGAYGYGMGYHFGTIPLCAEYLLHSDGRVRCIRRAEREEELFATLDCNSDFTELPEMR